MSSGPPLRRLGEALAERGLPVEPILSAINAAGSPRIYLAVSSCSPRIDVMLPFLPATLAAIAPEIMVPSIPAHAMLLISADGEQPESSPPQLGAAMIVRGAIAASEAVVDVAPASGREAWHPIVGSLLSLSGAVLTSRTRSLTRAHGTIAIRYLDREAEADAGLQDGIADVAKRLGMSEAHRALWRTVHAANGVGPAVTVAARCAATGPTPELGFLYRCSKWDHAIDLIKLIASVPLARSAAAGLGRLAGMLEIEEPAAVEVELGAAEPDVVVWVTLAMEQAA